ncbi:UNKNOWN [Stylonychia lemnae]|uniref:Uncharacterized protein n=1 Tax=Stylonychia lemnae TaxID=5949 RepID=A0A078BB70_STYLE|nr:UNKNOWN [Stylonychia lemnae]|eukprot:CDW90502.1 UNKNOWN [Stylonychia lemnae]
MSKPDNIAKYKGIWNNFSAFQSLSRVMIQKVAELLKRHNPKDQYNHPNFSIKLVLNLAHLLGQTPVNYSIQNKCLKATLQPIQKPNIGLQHKQHQQAY